MLKKKRSNVNYLLSCFRNVELFYKTDNGKPYYEAFGGQVTWVGAPNAE